MELLAVGAPKWRLEKVQYFIRHASRQIDQVDRRLLKAEVVAHEEKVFSVFEEHTRWISKGKAGCAVEFGVCVCVIEDQYQFILNHSIMWEGEDVEVAVEIIEDTQETYPDFVACSFDRGFYSPDNLSRLDGMLEHNVMPKKGKLSGADLQREQEEEFLKCRRQHRCFSG